MKYEVCSLTSDRSENKLLIHIYGKTPKDVADIVYYLEEVLADKPYGVNKETGEIIELHLPKNICQK